MLYKEYLIDSFGFKDYVTDTVSRRSFHCELLGDDNHRIGFSLIVQGCVGESDYQAQYRALEPLIKQDALWHCYFVYQMHQQYMQLCLAGVLPSRAVRMNGFNEAIRARDFLNPNRGYWAMTQTTGSWVQVSPISLHGQSYIPLAEYPRLVTYDEATKTMAPQPLRGRVARAINALIG